MSFFCKQDLMLRGWGKSDLNLFKEDAVDLKKRKLYKTPRVLCFEKATSKKVESVVSIFFYLYNNHYKVRNFALLKTQMDELDTLSEEFRSNRIYLLLNEYIDNGIYWKNIERSIGAKRGSILILEPKAHFLMELFPEHKEAIKKSLHDYVVSYEEYQITAKEMTEKIKYMNDSELIKKLISNKEIIIQKYNNETPQRVDDNQIHDLLTAIGCNPYYRKFEKRLYINKPAIEMLINLEINMGVDNTLKYAKLNHKFIEAEDLYYLLNAFEGAYFDVSKYKWCHINFKVLEKYNIVLNSFSILHTIAIRISDKYRSKYINSPIANYLLPSEDL